MSTYTQSSTTWSRHSGLKYISTLRVGAPSGRHLHSLTSSKTYKQSSIACKQGLLELCSKPFTVIKILSPIAKIKHGGSVEQKSIGGVKYEYVHWVGNVYSSRRRVSNVGSVSIKKIEVRSDTNKERVSIQCYGG
jgi:hypothetical protein